MNNSNDFFKFLTNHTGAIIGGLIAIIIAFTDLTEIMLKIIIVALGIWLGNYIQKNKNSVKEKLKHWIDKF